MKDLPKVPTWQLEVESNQRPSAPKAPTTTTQPTHDYRFITSQIEFRLRIIIFSQGQCQKQDEVRIRLTVQLLFGFISKLQLIKPVVPKLLWVGAHL